MSPINTHENTPARRGGVRDLLEQYQLAGFARKLPNQLSGGMRQRCALIRTLATSPDVLLLDEPFSALDYQTRLAVSGDISQIIRREHKTALLVTHDISEAISLSDRIVVLSHRPATVKAIHDLGALRAVPPKETTHTCASSSLYDSYFSMSPRLFSTFFMMRVHWRLAFTGELVGKPQLSWIRPVML